MVFPFLVTITVAPGMSDLKYGDSAASKASAVGSAFAGADTINAMQHASKKENHQLKMGRDLIFFIFKHYYSRCLEIFQVSTTANRVSNWLVKFPAKTATGHQICDQRNNETFSSHRCPWKASHAANQLQILMTILPVRSSLRSLVGPILCKSYDPSSNQYDVENEDNNAELRQNLEKSMVRILTSRDQHNRYSELDCYKDK